MGAMVTTDRASTANQPPPLRGYNLFEHAPEVADAFCASRLAEPSGVYGTLPSNLDLGAIVERHRPRL